MRNFAEELLKDKNRDILHGIDHSDRMLKAVDMISANYTYDKDILILVGTLMGQTLEETIDFIENNIFTNEKYYLPESKDSSRRTMNMLKNLSVT